MGANPKFPGIYLNDHPGGSTVGVELLNRLEERARRRRDQVEDHRLRASQEALRA